MQLILFSSQNGCITKLEQYHKDIVTKQTAQLMFNFIVLFSFMQWMGAGARATQNGSQHWQQQNEQLRRLRSNLQLCLQLQIQTNYIFLSIHKSFIKLYNYIIIHLGCWGAGMMVFRWKDAGLEGYPRHHRPSSVPPVVCVCVCVCVCVNVGGMCVHTRVCLVDKYADQNFKSLTMTVILPQLCLGMTYQSHA